MPLNIPISGAGIISAIGTDKAATLSSLLERRTGIGLPRLLGTAHSELPCGEVGLSNEEIKAQLGTGDEIVRTTLLGIWAAKEAIEEAGIRDFSRAAFISGTTVGGMDRTERHFLDYLDGDAHNSEIRLHDCCGCTDAIADYFGPFAYVTTVSTACSSAANAIILGAGLIRSGLFDIVVAGGTECLTRYHLNGFNSLMILDRAVCRPFDASRAGLNLGEGAAFVVLESEESARRRGAKPIAMLDGCGNACDAFHQTATSPEGEGAYKAMADALRTAGMQPADIQYVNAHGTGTVNNDETEARAMRRIFGESLPAVSSTKCYTGHTTSASGSIETVISILALQRQFLPVNLGWESPFEGGIVPVLDSVPAVSLQHVLCNSFGFGGNDSSLVISGV